MAPGSSGKEDEKKQNSQVKMINKKSISRIPPPKPRRYYLQQTSTNINKLENTHETENYKPNIQSPSKLYQARNKSSRHHLSKHETNFHKK